MSQNVNVINNVGKDVAVIVNKENDNVQIIINLAGKKVELSTLKAGDVFKVSDVEYIVLEQFENDTTAVIRKELLEDNMEFDSNNNNWKTSSIRKYLNCDYLKELNEVFGEDNIIEHKVNLLSLDGLDDYGTSTDKVSLLDIDQYRKYRRVIGGNKDNWWWLLTSDSTSSGWSFRDVRCVGSNGNVGYDGCCSYDGGVRPFFILKSDIFVSCDSAADSQ